MARAALVALLWASVACGCSQLDFDVSSDAPEWGETYRAEESAQSRERVEHLARALAAWESDQSRAHVGYAIGPGDVLLISVFALEQPDEMATLARSVTRDGTVALPWVGSIQAGGLTSEQLEASIAAAYRDSYLKQPQVSVTVSEYVSVPVVVTGAVGKPGIYALRANASTLLECLALAGGLLPTAGDEMLLVRGSGGSTPAPDEGNSPEDEGLDPTYVAQARLAKDTAVVDLRQLVDEGNLLLNLPVQGGDVLIVPPRSRRQVYVLGYVRQPGAYELAEEGRVDAVRAVALAGGLAGVARPANCFLIRSSEDRQKAIPVDLTKVIRGELPPLYLRPGDTLIVGTSTFGRLAEFFMPSMGASLSASASVAP